MALGVEKPSNKTKRCERPRQGRNGPKPIDSAVDGGNVRADTGAQTQNDEQASEPTGPTELAYLLKSAQRSTKRTKLSPR